MLLVGGHIELYHEQPLPAATAGRLQPRQHTIAQQLADLYHERLQPRTATPFCAHALARCRANNKLRPEDVKLGNLHRQFRSLVVDQQDKFAYAGSTTGDVMQVGMTRQAASQQCWMWQGSAGGSSSIVCRWPHLHTGPAHGPCANSVARPVQKSSCYLTSCNLQHRMFHSRMCHPVMLRGTV